MRQLTREELKECAVIAVMKDDRVEIAEGWSVEGASQEEVSRKVEELTVKYEEEALGAPKRTHPLIVIIGLILYVFRLVHGM